MSHPSERPRCPACRMPHDLTPGSLPMVVCASTLARIEAEDFGQWEREISHPGPPGQGVGVSESPA